VFALEDDMFIRMMIVAGLAVLMTGCLVSSLDPLYTDKEIVTDPGLVGDWAAQEGKDAFVIRELDATSYRMIFVDENGSSDMFVLHIVQIGGERFYDLFPEGPVAGSDMRQLHFVPVHTFGRFARNGDNLRLAALDEDWTKEQLQKTPGLIPHRAIDKQLVLTASTKQLQKFALDHVSHPKAFGDWAAYQRKR
jgi:hypothetical protein